MQISKEQNKAAGELVDLVASKLGKGRAVHSETAIACIARLAGSLLFRSFDFNVQGQQPGTVILSNEANEEGPQLISIMLTMLQHFGVSLNQEMIGSESSKSGGTPQLSLLESLALLQEDAMRIAQNNGLGMKEMAWAGAMATAFVVKECANNIGSETGFNIAVYSFIEGCKTMPPFVRSNSTPPNEKKPWYKLW